MSVLRLASFALLLATTTPVSAQTAFRSFQGTEFSETLGSSVSDAGDVNADGVPDLIVGSPTASFLHEAARVYSGRDGSLIHEFLGNQTTMGFGDDFGHAVSGVGDLNGDGHDDVLVGAPFESFMGSSIGFARAYSGLDGTLLYEIPGAVSGSAMGWAVSGVGDTNGDNVPDFMVGSGKVFIPGDPSPDVDLISGADGSSLHSFRGVSGQSLGGVEDLDGDGNNDLLLVTPTGARVVSGLTGNTIYTVTVADSISVSGAGDMNADGLEDFLVGHGAQVTAYSGLDASILYTFTNFGSGCRPGKSIDKAGDVNGDGFDDVIIGDCQNSGFEPEGVTRVYSGADGSLLFDLDAQNTTDYFGGAVSGAGDLNGDGFDDVIVGAPRSSNVAQESGNAFVYSGVQLDTIGPELCNGDGGDQMGCTDCPCGNNAPPGTVGGCLNSAGTSIQLQITGDPSVSLPSGSTSDLRAAISGGIPVSFCVLLSGGAVAPGNAANPCFDFMSGVQSNAFDGLRCAIQGVLRHGGRQSDANGDVGVTNSPWGGEGGPPAGISGQAGFTLGQGRYFQVLQREFPDLSCMRGLNTSQAIRVYFQP